jgi:HTH-type transcriptional regulator / antitoxin HigA
METLKYKVITSKRQYHAYCAILEALIFSGPREKRIKEEVALLTVLIEKWDDEHSALPDLDPVQLIRSFMRSHGLKSRDLVEILGVSKGYVSDMLNYRKGLSKAVIRKLAEHFKMSQEAFNRPYQLVDKVSPRRPLSI